MNQYDYSARYMDPGLARFTSVDPHAENYYSWSPYAYVANNPMRYVDLRGDSLTLSGEQNDLQKVADIHNEKLKGYYNVTVGTNGLLSMKAIEGTDMSKRTQSQQNYFNVLDRVVNGTDGMTTINVVKNSENVLIGSAVNKTIDIGDIQNLGNGTVGSSTALMHETWEQYKIQVSKTPVGNAHNQAISIENLISGQQSQGATIQYDYQNPKNLATSPTGTITVPIANRSPTIIRFRNNNIVTPIIR